MGEKRKHIAPEVVWIVSDRNYDVFFILTQYAVIIYFYFRKAQWITAQTYLMKHGSWSRQLFESLEITEGVENIHSNAL